MNLLIIEMPIGLLIGYIIFVVDYDIILWNILTGKKKYLNIVDEINILCFHLFNTLYNGFELTPVRYKE